MSGPRDTIEPFSRQQRGTVDAIRMAGRRSVVHGLVEFDVTEVRQRIHDRKEKAGEYLSFTAFLVFCLARTNADHPKVNAYRDWRGRIVQFDDVGVMVIIEVEIGRNRIGVPHVIRAANRRSLQLIHDIDSSI
jgi:pyruvate/2-oxoglutarate dehydrogenase complex dihydrolipoamide acyltransferase (E2) component